MYAVIRAGGKQYRVAPGDVIHIERTPHEKGMIEFSDVLAVSGEAGKIGKPSAGARVVGSVVEEGRADKILVFHFKRKKQYKKIAGHRQPFTAVRITEISFDGQKFAAPELPKAQPKPKRAPDQADTGLTAADMGEPGAKGQHGASKSVRTVESQAGRKEGTAKHTAGAKSQATRAAKGGAEKKHKASAQAKKNTGKKKK